jgi:cytochrome c-type biogenesis protein CcmH/NrfG
MTSRKKIALTILFLSPVIAGLLALAKFEKSREAGQPFQPSKAAIPANPAHEMASLEVELKKNPSHMPILLRMAELKRDAGKGEEAIQLLRKAAEIDDSSIEARLELGRALFESGDSNGAIAATQAILQKDPKHVDALYNLGAIFGNTGNDAAAREYCKRAVAAGPTTDSGRKALAALEVLDSAGRNPHNAAVHR